MNVCCRTLNVICYIIVVFLKCNVQFVTFLIVMPAFQTTVCANNTHYCNDLVEQDLRSILCVKVAMLENIGDFP